MSISQNYGNTKPSLLLDFANVKKLDPRVTFARASEGRYYDGVTTAKAEENLLRYSQEFDNAAWTNASITVSANSTAAPDGTTTADTATRASTGELSQSPSVTNGKTYTVSVFAKAGTGNFLQIALGVGGFTANDWANFDLNTGVVGNKGSSATSSIQSIGGGWYRCVMTCTAVSTQTASFAFCPLDADTASRKPTNSVSASNILWGAQLEQRSSVTDYTPTTTQPITNYIPVLQTAAANVARFDHDPVTGESLGLLVEEQRTNLLTYSEDFGNAAWSKADVTVSANQVVAPDGALAGDKFIPNTSNAVHRAFIGLLGSAGANTVSAYMKKGEYTWGVLRIEGVNSFFNLDLGTVGTVGAGNTATITHVGNGWYRCTTTRTIAGSTISTIGVASADNTDTFTGDGYSGIYIWGAQLEAGAFPTSYIPTTSSQVTRSADAASMTGTNFSEWFSNAEGTLYAEFMRQGTNTSGQEWRIFALGDIDLSVVTNQTRFKAFGDSNVNLYPGDYSADVYSKIAGAYKVNDFAASINGGTVVADTVGTLGTVTAAYIGNRPTGGRNLNGHIKKLAYYPLRLSNANLQALTGS